MSKEQYEQEHKRLDHALATDSFGQSYASRHGGQHHLQQVEINDGEKILTLPEPPKNPQAQSAGKAPHARKTATTESYQYGHSGKYQRESASKLADAYYGGQYDYPRSDYYGYQYNAYHGHLYDSTAYRHADQYRRTAGMPPPDAQLAKAGLPHSHDSAYADGQHSANRGSGGISKSQAIPSSSSYRHGNPHQQHLTSQQIYQQNYYYMRKYKQQRSRLEEDLRRDLTPSERELKQTQLRKLKEKFEHCNASQ